VRSSITKSLSGCLPITTGAVGEITRGLGAVGAMVDISMLLAGVKGASPLRICERSLQAGNLLGMSPLTGHHIDPAHGPPAVELVARALS
jgi:hypothetical protein